MVMCVYIDACTEVREGRGGSLIEFALGYEL
jgi:hypothetical protein